MMTYPTIQWPLYRRFDQTLDLKIAYRDVFDMDASEEALKFLDMVNAMRPIKSRQIAAIVLVFMKEREVGPTVALT